MMKNKDILKMFEGLNQISQIKFKPKTSYILAKDKIILEPYYQTIIKCQQDIWESFGEKTNEGFRIPNEKIEEANNAMKELMEVENNIVLDGVSIDDFGDEVIDMETLEKIIDIIKM